MGQIPNTSPCHKVTSAHIFEWSQREVSREFLTLIIFQCKYLLLTTVNNERFVTFCCYNRKGWICVVFGCWYTFNHSFSLTFVIHFSFPSFIILIIYLLYLHFFFIRTSKNQVKLKMFLVFLRGVKLDIKNVLKIQCIFKKKSR